MEQVARRAGVGKAALYRRWSGKEAMVLALIEAIDLPTVRSEDKGSLQADLLDYLRNAARLLRRPLMRRLLPEFYAEMSRGGPLGDALRVKLLGLKGFQVQELVERARRRGEVGHMPDSSLASALIIGPIYWTWMIEQRPLDESVMQGMAMSLASALSTYK